MKEEHDCAKLVPIGARPQFQLDRAQSALDKLRAWGAGKKAAASASQGQTSKTAGSGSPSSSMTAGLRKTVSRGISGNMSSGGGGGARKTTALADLNALKRTAKGDDKIPSDKRIYLHVEASADTTTAKFPTGKFFYSTEWSVGRVLDAAAKSLQVQNVNNRVEGEDQRLRVFHVEGGRLLEFSERLGKSVGSGNTVVLLRGVGPAVPDLIEA